MSVVGSLGSACSPETIGRIEVVVSLHDRGGAPQSCEDFGAEQIEVRLFAEQDDPIATDRITRTCAVSEAGRGRFTARVATGTYARAEVRFLSESGNVLRMCTTEGSAEALLSVDTVRVGKDATGLIEVAIEADSGRCATQ